MIKTILILIYVFVAAIFLMPFGIIAMFFYILGLKKLMITAVYKIAKGWAWLTILFTGAKVSVSGISNIPKQGSVCFVSNHCGYFDIMLLLAYCGRPFGFIAKKELLLLPFFNAWIYMLGGLFIDRKSVKKAIKTINKGVLKIKNGGGMLVFPEGHRSKGRGLLPFHPGSLKLATQANAPIVPVAIHGSYEVFEKTGRICKSDIKVIFCPVIETVNLSNEEKKQALCDKIYTVIKEKLDENNAS